MSNRFEIGSAIDPGMKRRQKPNQDMIGYVSGTPTRAPLLILADGMGGYNGGETASRLTVETVKSAYQASDFKDTGYREILTNCTQEAFDAICRQAEADENISRMGSTVVLAALTEKCVYITNVGDSRAYRITSSGVIEQISFDHSLVMDQVRAGIITREEAMRHPQRNVLSMSLTRQRPSVDPYSAEIPWDPGDYVLICSDGLWGTVSEAQMSNIVTSLEPQQAADKLIKMANMNQGPDNISVMIARNGPRSDSAETSENVSGFNGQVTGENLVLVNNSRSRWPVILLCLLLLVILLAAAVLLIYNHGRLWPLPQSFDFGTFWTAVKELLQTGTN